MRKREYIKKEVYINKGLFFKKIWHKFFYGNTASINLIRKYLFTKNRFRRKWLKEKLMRKYGIYVDESAKIGIGLEFSHAHNIYITNATIGKNARIYQGVTIGQAHKYQRDTAPKIGDNVTIYANAVVAGDITIGDNVTIGANSVVINDVPSNSVVAGNPGRIIKRK